MTNPSTDAHYSVYALGPLTVMRADAPIDLGGPKQRLVLALLLSGRDRVVATSRLIDGLWGEQPPATARKAIQVHVSNLRRALGEEFPLRTASSGYLVRSAELDYDVKVFEESVTRATALLRTDPTAASSLLSQALAIWRGSAFADLEDEAAIAPEIARLDQLRLTALERRIDADLRLGRHAELVGELETLAVEHPYHERFREQEMLALYRSGRQTEALRAYDHTRTTLVEELGIEPSPSLRALHTQILEQAPELEYVGDPGEPTYAFLATDLEDSTALWEADPDVMQVALARHDELLASAVEASSGTVFKGTGDGIYAVFASAVDALQAAVDAQLALASETWPTDRPLLVRMAVDEGPASNRDGDYFGPALNRVSRIMSSGHGRQLLVPASLAAQSPLPVRDLGTADYKGVGRIEVAQVDIPGLPEEFPSLRTDRAPAGVPRHGFGRAIRGYELREQLGTGASGIVFRAYQSSIGREVAIKVIRPELANRSGFVKRFEAEAQFVAQLEHPHIVPLYDYWRDPDGAYLVMQLLRGASLADSLERSPWRPAAALRLLDQIGAALDYAHRHGVLHRDLKPANVLLDGDGNAFLSDFGIATDHIDAVGLPAESSVAYISPEELAGLPIGTATDIYGLTLLAYETLTGERPEPGGHPDPVTTRRPDLPLAIDRVFERGTHPDPAQRYPRVADLLRDLRQAFGADAVDAPQDDVPVEVRNPFKGLRAFKETDAADFFGRDELVAELVEHVSTHQFTAVVGPSGSGKSSVVRAGLLPEIRRGALDVVGGVLITEMYPGSYPFEELESALVRVAVTPTAGTMADLLGDDRGLLRVAKQILPDDDSELVLVIDQFEELFSLTTDPDTREHFLASLVEVVRDERSRVRIVVTMRADYFDRPLEHAEFGDVLRNGIVPIAAPREHELAAAIARPVDTAGLEFEPGLVARIVRDVADQPGALPLLQYALTTLVDQRQGRMLDTAAYDRIGGVEGALATRAEEIYQGLTLRARRASTEVFLRLVRVDDHADDTRRRAGRPELESLGFAEGVVDEVVSAFGSFRLLAFDRDPVSRGQTVEVAHEALLREWPRYRGWIAERREALLVERRLESAAAEWDATGRPADLLISGGRLEQFEHWADDEPVPVPSPADDYLAESRKATDANEHRRAAARRKVVTLVGVLAVLALVAAGVAWVQRGRALDQERVALAAAELAEQEADNASTAEALALSSATEADGLRNVANDLRIQAEARADAESARRLGALAEETIDEDADLAVLLAVEAGRRAVRAGSEFSEPRQALFSTTLQHRLSARLSAWDVAHTNGSIVAVEPTGNRFAAVVAAGPEQADRRAEIVNADGGGRVDIDVDEPTSVTWHASDDVVAVGDASGVIWFVDPATGSVLRSIDSGAEWVKVEQLTGSAILFRVGDGEQIVGEGTPVVADPISGDVMLEQRAGFWAELSPSGAYVLFGGLRDDADSNSRTATVRALSDGAVIWSLDIDNIDRRLMTWAADADVLLWATQDMLTRIDPISLGESVLSMPQQDGSIPSAIASSSDGRLIAIGAVDGTIRVVDLATLELVAHLAGHSGAVGDLDWIPGRDALLSIGADREIIVWDLSSPPPAPASVWSGSSGFPLAHVVASSSERIVEVRDPNQVTAARVEIWSSGSAVDVVEQTDANVFVLGQRNGSTALLATARSGPNSGITVRDLSAGAVVLDLPGDLDHPLAISADGRTVVATIGDASIDALLPPRVCAIDIGTAIEQWCLDEVRSQSSTNTGTPVGFVRNGEVLVLATGSTEDRIPYQLSAELLAVDMASGEVLASRALETSDANIAVSQTGGYVAIAENGGRVSVIDVEKLLAGDERSVVASTRLANGGFPPFGLAFSEDETILYTPAGLLSSDLLALAVDDSLQVLWSIDADLDGEGPSAISRPVVYDGSVWIGMPFSPGGPTGSTEFGLVAIPTDLSEYADWASSLPTRGFTEAECVQYLGGSCADSVSDPT